MSGNTSVHADEPNSNKRKRDSGDADTSQTKLSRQARKARRREEHSRKSDLEEAHAVIPPGIGAQLGREVREKAARMPLASPERQQMSPLAVIPSTTTKQIADRIWKGEVQTHSEETDWRSLAITKAQQMPKDMIKYWYNRYHLFSRFDEGILMDSQSWYSVTPEAIAARIATRCLYPLLHQQRQEAEASTIDDASRELVILDLFCGAGGNAIQFALAGMELGERAEGPPIKTRVIAIDIDPIKVQYARHNACIYGAEDHIHFLEGDAFDFVRDWTRAKADCSDEGVGSSQGKKVERKKRKESSWEGQEKRRIDVIFLSPPWGGVDYQNATSSSASGIVIPSRPPANLEIGHEKDKAASLSLPEAAAASEKEHSAITASLMASSLPTSFSTPSLNRQKDLLAAQEESVTNVLGEQQESEQEQSRQEYAYYTLSSMAPLPAKDLYRTARQITPNVVLYLPRNCDLREIADLPATAAAAAGEGSEGAKLGALIDVEEQFLGSRLKALTVYFGALATEWEE